MNKIMIITEYYEGEYECRGEVYQNTIILNLDKLDALSKLKIETSLLAKWQKEEDFYIDPINDEDWSFEDIMESLYSFRVMDSFHNGQQNISTIELDKKTDDDVKKIIYAIKDKKTSGQTVFLEKILRKSFTENEINDVVVTDKFSLEIKTSLFLNDNNIS
jgi:hypothetical protein